MKSYYFQKQRQHVTLINMCQRESRLELGLVANDFTVTTGVLRNDSKLSMDGYTRKTLNVFPGLRMYKV